MMTDPVAALHPLLESCYVGWTSTYRGEHCYGYDYLYAGPLFTHQLSHIWIDFRGLQDAYSAPKVSIISRTAAAQPMCNNSMR